jgi:hypothetical protein
LLDFHRLLFLAVVVLMVFFALALTFILCGTEKWVTLGFKIFELSTQMVLVAVLGGVLVQAYIKWHSRESSMNEFRKDTAEVVIREYSAVKKVRRLLRATCIQGPAGDRENPWTDVPVATYDIHIDTINDVQLALELVKRRLKFYCAVFQNPNELSLKAGGMEQYLGNIISEYERHRNPALKRDSISLAELDCLRGFILREKASDFDSFSHPFGDLLRLLEAEGVWVAL